MAIRLFPLKKKQFFAALHSSNLLWLFCTQLSLFFSICFFFDFSFFIFMLFAIYTFDKAAMTQNVCEGMQ